MLYASDSDSDSVATDNQPQVPTLGFVFIRINTVLYLQPRIFCDQLPPINYSANGGGWSAYLRVKAAR